MNTEERLRSHLERATAGLPDVDRLEAIVAEGGRRRVRTRVGVVLATAAAVAVVVMAGQALQPITGQSPVLSQPGGTSVPSPGETTLPPETTPPPATAGNTVNGILVADAAGVRVVSTDGETVRQLTSDPGYGEISVAFEDRRGGIVFQHAATPLPWPQGSLLRLAAGETTPTVVASPPEGGRLVPVGPAGAAGETKFVYLVDTPAGDLVETTMILVDLDSGETVELGELGPYAEVTVGGELVSLVDRESNDCPTHSLRRLDGTDLPSPLPDCLTIAAGVTVAGNGFTLGVLDQGEFNVYSIEGENVGHSVVPDAYMATATTGGWALRTPTETILLNHGGGEAHLDPVETGWVAPYSTPLDLAAGATLGSGSGDLPCQADREAAIETALARQELPAAVAATRATIHAAAVACDYTALGALAEADATTFSYGGGTDPVAFWVAEGTQGRDPLSLMARLLSTTPAQDTETGTWAWPAAHIDPTDEASWAELEDVFDAETFALLRQADGYLGYRIGITADGTWAFAVGGD